MKKVYCLLIIFLLPIALLQSDSLTTPSEDQRPSDCVVSGYKGPVRLVEWSVQEMDKKCKDFVWREKSLWKKEHYDNCGNLVLREQFNAGVLTSSNSFETNSQGKMSITKYFDMTGKNGEKSRFLRQLNHQGKIIDEKSVSSDGDLLITWVFKWDNDEKKDTVSVFDADGSLTGTAEWYYDDLFRVIKKKSKTMGVLVKYDEQWRIKRKEKIDYRNNEKLVMTFKDGRQVKDEFFPLDGELKNLCVFKHEFDDQGNWIKQTQIILPLPGDDWPKQECKKIYRGISYYQD
jgi:hypothetical protein